MRATTPQTDCIRLFSSDEVREYCDEYIRHKLRQERTAIAKKAKAKQERNRRITKKILAAASLIAIPIVGFALFGDADILVCEMAGIPGAMAYTYDAYKVLTTKKED